MAEEIKTTNSVSDIDVRLPLYEVFGGRQILLDICDILNTPTDGKEIQMIWRLPEGSKYILTICQCTYRA